MYQFNDKSEFTDISLKYKGYAYLKVQEKVSFFLFAYYTSGQGSTWQSFIEQWPSSAQKGHGRFRLTLRKRVS